MIRRHPFKHTHTKDDLPDPTTQVTSMKVYSGVFCCWKSNEFQASRSDRDYSQVNGSQFSLNAPLMTMALSNAKCLMMIASSNNLWLRAPWIAGPLRKLHPFPCHSPCVNSFAATKRKIRTCNRNLINTDCTLMWIGERETGREKEREKMDSVGGGGADSRRRFLFMRVLSFWFSLLVCLGNDWWQSITVISTLQSHSNECRWFTSLPQILPQIGDNF